MGVDMSSRFAEPGSEAVGCVVFRAGCSRVSSLYANSLVHHESSKRQDLPSSSPASLDEGPLVLILWRDGFGAAGSKLLPRRIAGSHWMRGTGFISMSGVRVSTP